MRKQSNEHYIIFIGDFGMVFDGKTKTSINCTLFHRLGFEIIKKTTNAAEWFLSNIF